MVPAEMSNVLDDDKKQQIVALGRLGWSLRRIEQTTGVRRETAGAYLRAAGMAVRGRGGRPGAWPPKPATTAEVSTDSPPGAWPPAPGRIGAPRVGGTASTTTTGPPAPRPPRRSLW